MPWVNTGLINVFENDGDDTSGPKNGGESGGYHGGQKEGKNQARNIHGKGPYDMSELSDVGMDDCGNERKGEPV